MSWSMTCEPTLPGRGLAPTTATEVAASMGVRGWGAGIFGGGASFVWLLRSGQRIYLFVSPRQKLTAVRRQQILEAAGSVIAERGICETRIADISDVLGVSPALILYYFPSKERLLGEALAHQDRQFFEEVAERASGLDSTQARLILIIEASCPTASRRTVINDEYVLWLEMWARCRQDPELAEARQRMDQEWRHAIATIVLEGQRTGEFSSTVDAIDFALQLSALIDGLAIQVVLGDSDVDAAVMRRLCVSMAGSDLGFDVEDVI
ncbi:MAG TPA: TetR family transcriptional regulator C-terminal domain-containing protein [Acidimicrobiia bacterium]|nr:TetR family transcriptional regulator C-terminal domain-containing protein [Acidimicrobiia bacterium]